MEMKEYGSKACQKSPDLDIGMLFKAEHELEL